MRYPVRSFDSFSAHAASVDSFLQNVKRTWRAPIAASSHRRKSSNREPTFYNIIWLAARSDVASLVGTLLPAERAAVYRLKRAGRGGLDRGDYLWQVFFDDG